MLYLSDDPASYDMLVVQCGWPEKPGRDDSKLTLVHHHRAAAALNSPTSIRLSAHTVSRLNHVRDTAR